MAISTNYPNLRPSLLLDFANEKALDPRVTFSRPTTATYYDGITSAIAEQNLFTQSQTFDNADWGKTATSVTANSTVAPDGTTTADTVTADGTTGAKLISGSNMGTVAAPATARTVSVYAKAGTNNYLQIYFNGDATPWADFDLSLGTVGSTGSNQTASIVSVGSGWYRCILYTASTTATTCNFAIVSSSSAARAENNSLATSVILWGAQLEQRSSATAYNATTTTAITNYIPVLQTAATNTARFDHNPTTGESLGLLIEEQRTNLLTYSSAFDNAAWTKGNVTLTTAANIAPDGTQTSQKIIPTSTNGSHYFNQSITTTVSTTYTYSFYAKAGEYSWVIAGQDSGGTGYFWVNLTTGAIGNTSGTYLSNSVTSVGNGWYRISITYSAANTSASGYAFVTTGNGTLSYAGNGYSGVFIWGAQLEAGAFSTSYIPTVASQVTRSADSASMTGTNFSSWFNISQGTVYAEAAGSTVVGASTIYAISDGTGNNRIVGAVGSAMLFVGVGGVQQVNLSVGSDTANTFAKYAGFFSTNNFGLTRNGATASTASSGSIPTVTTLYIGSGATGTAGFLGGRIKKLAYYPQAVTSAQIQALTGS